MICHMVLSARKKHQAEKGQGDRGRGSLAHVCAVNEEVRHRLTERVTSEPRPKDSEGAGSADTWEKAIPGNR